MKSLIFLYMVYAISLLSSFLGWGWLLEKMGFGLKMTVLILLNVFRQSSGFFDVFCLLHTLLFLCLDRLDLLEISPRKCQTALGFRSSSSGGRSCGRPSTSRASRCPRLTAGSVRLSSARLSRFSLA